LGDGYSVYLGSVLIGVGLGTFEGYCVDLQHFSGDSPEYAEADSMLNWGVADSSVTNGTAARLGGGAAAWLYNSYAKGADNTGRAALQLAIWNALYDTDYTVLGGAGFSVTSALSAHTDLADKKRVCWDSPALCGAACAKTDTNRAIARSARHAFTRRAGRRRGPPPRRPSSFAEPGADPPVTPPSRWRSPAFRLHDSKKVVLAGPRACRPTGLARVGQPVGD
jgi:hypothetical protein